MNKLAIFIGGPFDGTGMLVRGNDPFILLPVRERDFRPMDVLLMPEIDLNPSSIAVTMRMARYVWQDLFIPDPDMRSMYQFGDPDTMTRNRLEIRTKVMIYSFEGIDR